MSAVGGRSSSRDLTPGATRCSRPANGALVMGLVPGTCCGRPRFTTETAPSRAPAAHDALAIRSRHGQNFIRDKKIGEARRCSPPRRLITETGPGTRCGALMRCYWQPAALVEELDGPRPVKRLRLLGEDLVLFRDPLGRYGLLHRRCAHRGADLSFGRCADGGLPVKPPL